MSDGVAAVQVRQFVLDTLASDPGLTQTELLFLGLFGRACRLLSGPPDPQVWLQATHQQRII